MITDWILTGDLHGDVAPRITEIKMLFPEYKPNDTGVIVLGDAGFNYFLDSREDYKRSKINNYGYQFYCLRGNHEERPQNIAGMQLVFDPEVQGEVYVHPEYPNLHYFKDCGSYLIGGYKVAVIGGAYSVDKHWRLETNNKWFSDEQLSAEEMSAAEKLFVNQEFDFVFSHTCPTSFQPKDMFLSFVNQSTVDTTMEDWMEKLKDTFAWGVWMFGHYHIDRLEKPYVECLYNHCDTLDEIMNRWRTFANDKESIRWYRRSPNFYN